MAEPIELYDEDGDPTPESLAQLASFEGSPRQFIECATSLYQQGGVIVDRGTDDWGNPLIQIRFITRGISGPERVSAVIDRTLFHQSFWESSHRGGLTVYRVPQAMWEQSMQWGIPKVPGGGVGS